VNLKASADRRVSTTKSDERGKYKLALVHAPFLAGELALTVRHARFSAFEARMPSGGARTIDVVLSPL
jgi:hypothetical protein